MYFTTNLTYSADDTYQGYLIQYTSGKWGWINYSNNDGGNDRLYGTQAVNGPAYDTMVPTDTFDLYAPSDLVEIHLVNTANNGLELDQADNLKIRRANITSGASAGKIVIYQSRVNFQDCYFGSTIGRILINNGTLLLSNDYLACDGESGFGMVGASGGATIQAKGGTTFDGNLSTTNDTPLMARAGARITFSGPVMFRGCTAIELKNGAEIDYNSGYDADVSMYWWEMSGTEPCVRVDAFDGGTPVRGRIPDIHGDTRDIGTRIVVANAPCQLWLGYGSSMAITGKSAGAFSVSTNNNGASSSGEAYDRSFIRMDRARGSGALGTNYGPHEVTISGGTPTADIDLMYGTSQKFDCSGATASTTVTWDVPNNGTFGEWLTLEIVQGTTLTHTWNAAFVWAGGSPPALSTVSGQRDLLRFYYTGADWVGEAVALNVS
jgi:hypothetical protein